MARPARALVQADPNSLELWDMDRLSTELDLGLECLHRAPCCLKCSAPLLGQLHATAADIDQAFEACEGSRVARAWQGVLCRAKAPAHPAVLVRRSRRCLTKIADNACGRGWWKLSIEQVTLAVLSANILTLVLLGPLVLQLYGCAIGAIMSAVSVSIVLGNEESDAHASHILRTT